MHFILDYLFSFYHLKLYLPININLNSLFSNSIVQRNIINIDKQLNFHYILIII